MRWGYHPKFKYGKCFQNGLDSFINALVSIGDLAYCFFGGQSKKSKEH